MSNSDTSSLDPSSLADACRRAAEVVYAIDRPTPMESMQLEFDTGPGEIFLKREDLSTIRSYKWRGAYFKIAHCVESGNRGPFVATSAGNHAQGVALAAHKLDVKATIFMPQTTPKLKQKAVRKYGGGNVDVVLVGDSYDEAATATQAFAESNQATILPPFDDPDVIAGQSTVASELVGQKPDLEYLFLPIGGGGLASGVAFALAEVHHHPVKVIGVEVAGQDSMTKSISKQERITLEKVDPFCDGTAVGRPGSLTLHLCQKYLAGSMTVTNERVCASIQRLWEEKRVITEPSGAIGLAGLQLAAEQGQVDPTRSICAAVLTGGNTDFLTLPLIVGRSQLAQPTRKYYRFEIPEKSGSLIDLLDQFLDGINIVDFQYGKKGLHGATPVLGLSATPSQLDAFEHRIQSSNIVATEVTDHQATLFRVIPFRPDLTRNAVFLHVDFPDRPGALRDMMREISTLTNICYFNFNDSGQSEGHALIGFEFDSPDGQQELLAKLSQIDIRFRIVNMSRLGEF